MKLVIFDWGRTLYDPESEALFPETKNVLEYLKSKNYTLAIVALATAGQTKIDERLKIIEKEELIPFFASIKFDVENKDKMYADTLTELGYETRDTVVVDDRVLRGICWGNKNGCQTIWFKNGKFAEESPNEETGLPEYTITSLKELEDIL